MKSNKGSTETIPNRNRASLLARYGTAPAKALWVCFGLRNRHCLDADCLKAQEWELHRDPPSLGDFTSLVGEDPKHVSVEANRQHVPALGPGTCRCCTLVDYTPGWVRQALRLSFPSVTFCPVPALAVLGCARA